MGFLRSLPALFFLAISTYAGMRLVRFLLPQLDGTSDSTKPRAVAPWVILLPASFLAGTLLVTWATYLTASAFRNASSQMGVANGIVLGFLVVVLSIDFILRRRASLPRAV